jgi:hypothetical protein
MGGQGSKPDDRLPILKKRLSKGNILSDIVAVIIKLTTDFKFVCLD